MPLRLPEAPLQPLSSSLCTPYTDRYQPFFMSSLLYQIDVAQGTIDNAATY